MISANLNYHHLYHFWIVAQEGSLVGASRRLGIRHSTLSTQLRALEEALGASLLLRRPRGVRLTPRGETVLGYCDQIFRLGAELVEATATPASSRLRVGMPASVPRALLYDGLRHALDRQQATRLEVLVGDIDTLARELLAGRLHLVMSDRLPSKLVAAPLQSHLVGETRIGLYGTRRLAERYKPGFPVSLDGAPVLMPLPGSALRDGLASWFAAQGVKPKIVGEFDDAPMMKGFAARGHGLVPVGLSLAHETRNRYGLVAVGTVPGLRDRVYALTLGRRMRHPGVQRLIERCQARRNPA